MIFNKNDNGAEEIKALIGFVDAAITFSNLNSFMAFAKKQVTAVIGPEIYKLAEDHYLSNDYQNETNHKALLDELVERIQLPMALHAYRRYAPGNDLRHGDIGRHIIVTETEKPAFEWQIEKDNANLLALANDATELLLDFLDAQLEVEEGEEMNEIGDTWNNSAAFAAIRSTIVNSIADFEEVIPINESRRLFLLLGPFIRKVEIDLIRPSITSLRYEALIEAIRDGNLSDEQREIRRLALPVIVQNAMARALKLMPAEVLPDAFALRFADDRKSEADTDARLGAAQVLEQQAKLDFSKLQRYIRLISEVDTSEEHVDTSDKPYFIA